VRAIHDGRWRKLPDLGESDRALCELAEKLSRTPWRMTEDDWRPLRELGFDDECCLELAHVVGIFSHLVRLADGLGLALDEPTAEAARTGVALSRPSARAG
jgi:alkylhydroperoxidase family enzyme